MSRARILARPGAQSAGRFTVRDFRPSPNPRRRLVHQITYSQVRCPHHCRFGSSRWLQARPGPRCAPYVESGHSSSKSPIPRCTRTPDSTSPRPRVRVRPAFRRVNTSTDVCAPSRVRPLQPASDGLLPAWTMRPAVPTAVVPARSFYEDREPVAGQSRVRREQYFHARHARGR